MKRPRRRKKPEVGNKAEDTTFFPKIQKKLSVGSPGDKYEMEADRMADTVVSNESKGGTVQKMGSSEETVQEKPLATSITPVQKKDLKPDSKTVQKMENEEPAQAKEEEEPVQAMEEEEAQAKEEEEPVQAMEEEEAQAKEEEEPVQAMEEEEAQAKEEEEPVQAMEEEEAQAKEEEEPVQAMEEEEAQAKEEEEPVQARFNNSQKVSSGIESTLHNTKGGGSKMDDTTLSNMEKGFGADFSHVKIHTDSTAEKMSKDMGAQAFTHGDDIYFNQGKYNPNLKEGKHLLAHELTHTVQQRGMVQKKIQKKDLTSFRFKGNDVLESVLDGKLLIKLKSKGAHVRIIQQALIDAGFSLPIYGVDGDFGGETKGKVIAFQKARKLPKKEQDGAVGPITMGELDAQYSGYKTEHDQFAGMTEAELNTKTRDITPEEEAALKDAMNREAKVDPITGKPPDFKIKQATQYEADLKKRTEKILLFQYKTYGKGKASKRKKKDLHQPSTIDSLAKVSKTETDKVFGGIKQGDPLEFGKNIRDRWTDKKNDLKGKTKKQKNIIRTRWANHRVKKILEGQGVEKVNKKYNAIQSRKDEKKIVTRVKKDLVKAYKKELALTHMGWPGAAGGGKIFLQRFKSTAPKKDDRNNENRLYMWENFNTIIHEYLHTLEDKKTKAYRNKIPDKKGGKVLREGVPEYFTKIVWFNINFADPKFREKVETPFYDSSKTDTPKGTFYDEAKNAERMAGIVGLPNLMGYFFHGKIELIDI